LLSKTHPRHVSSSVTPVQITNPHNSSLPLQSQHLPHNRPPPRRHRQEIHKFIHAAFAATLNHFGRVDIVAKNAGYGLAGPFKEFSDPQIRTQMEFNLFGLMNVTREGALGDARGADAERRADPAGDFDRRAEERADVQNLLRVEVGGRGVQGAGSARSEA
jgi:hypothetical protein